MNSTKKHASKTQHSFSGNGSSSSGAAAAAAALSNKVNT